MKTNRIGLAVCATVTSFCTAHSFAADFDTTVPMHDKGAATYYVSVSVNERVVSDFQVDTGSGYVTINKKILKQLMQEKGAVFVKKIAAVTGSGFLAIMPQVANHFIRAEVRHFDYDDKDAALNWLKAGK